VEAQPQGVLIIREGEKNPSWAGRWRFLFCWAGRCRFLSREVVFLWLPYSRPLGGLSLITPPSPYLIRGYYKEPPSTYLTIPVGRY